MVLSCDGDVVIIFLKQMEYLKEANKKGQVVHESFWMIFFLGMLNLIMMKRHSEEC